MSKDELKINPVRKSLLTPLLFAGGERELALMVGMVAVAMIIFVQTWIAFFTGILMLIVIFPLLRQMAKKDVQMSKVYRRSLNYQKFYPPTGTIYITKANKQTSTTFKR